MVIRYSAETTQHKYGIAQQQQQQYHRDAKRIDDDAHQF